MRLALIADTHLSDRSPECVANWHAAACAIRHLGVESTVHLGDITLDAQAHRSELAFPVPRPNAAEHGRGGRYVQDAAARRLLHGALAPTLRLVVSGHTHQYLDTFADGIRHLWMPSCAFVLPDSMQARIGEKVVGIGVLTLATARRASTAWFGTSCRH